MFASGGRRRSEVAAAVIEHLTALEDGSFLYRLGHSKTDEAGTDDNPNATKPLVGPAAEAMRAWLAESGSTSGKIFRRIRKTKAVEPLSAQAVWHIVKRRARLAGLEADYGAHSLRSGFVTEARPAECADGQCDGAHRAPERGNISQVLSTRRCHANSSGQSAGYCE